MFSMSNWWKCGVSPSCCVRRPDENQFTKRQKSKKTLMCVVLNTRNHYIPFSKLRQNPGLCPHLLQLDKQRRHFACIGRVQLQTQFLSKSSVNSLKICNACYVAITFIRSRDNVYLRCHYKTKNHAIMLQVMPVCCDISNLSPKKLL